MQLGTVRHVSPERRPERPEPSLRCPCPVPSPPRQSLPDQERRARLYLDCISTVSPCISLIRRDEHAFSSGARRSHPAAAREAHSRDTVEIQSRYSRDTCASARVPSEGAHHGAHLTPSAPSSCLLSGRRWRACGRPRAPPRPSARHSRRRSRRHSRPQTVPRRDRVLAAPPRPRPR